MAMLELHELSARFQPLFHRFASRERLATNPPLLAHYTSVETLEKILRCEEIWLSNPLYMNDLEEMRFGVTQGAQLFLTSEIVSQVAGTDERANILHNAFRHCHNDLTQKGALDVYVFCLSEHDRGDTDGRLSMWRGYGGHGNGAALVFDAAKLHDPPEAPFFVSEISYGSTDTRLGMLNHLLTDWSQICRSTNMESDQLWIAAYYFFQALLVFALVTKHLGFKEEHEWRVVYVPQNDPHKLLKSSMGYAIGDHGVEPKLKFKLASPIPGFLPGALSLDNLVHSIILGPTVSSDLSVLATKRMLERIGKQYLLERVTASRIPLRPRGA
jgi:hypothetical protein